MLRAEVVGTEHVLRPAWHEFVGCRETLSSEKRPAGIHHPDAKAYRLSHFDQGHCDVHCTNDNDRRWQCKDVEEHAAVGLVQHVFFWREYHLIGRRWEERNELGR
jgi:hypothetical protein